ncbi:MAG: SpoIIE family protein phosphatase [Acidobacteriia bacterium]|nr:SpoIIE family protein phosphatase [Terriglobia bacterium]
MASSLTMRLRTLWLRMNRMDVAALAILIVYAVLWGLRFFLPQTPQSGFLIFLVLLVLGYFAVRGFLWAREHLLWSLRNRLMIAYVFIAVVPVLLLLTMAGLAAYLLYWQLGSYVLYTGMQDCAGRVERVAQVAGTMATSYAIEAPSGRSVAALVLPEHLSTYLKAAMTGLPGLEIDETGKGEDLLRRSDGSSRNSFTGLVLSGGALTLRAVVARQTPSGRLVVSAFVPVTPELIDTLGAELGPIQLDVLRLRNSTSSGISVVINGQEYTRVQQIVTRQRTIPQAAYPFDKLITGIVALDVLDQDREPAGTESPRVFASFSTRPSLLNRKLFSPLGELGGVAATALLVVGAVFLLIEIGSLVTGIVLTRTITTAVGDLYRATQHVQTGDLTFRVRVPHHDQLAALGESFNSMMHSVSTLIEEQRQRQRLEHELSIAHEVQQQLFPHVLPRLPGVELEAICRAAKMVSGDYYDFIRISPTRLAIALSDISGKGISAALLMANVQAVLRSDVLRYRDVQPGKNYSQISTAEIVSHLNRHLYRNTTAERYATFFLAVYDTETRRLSYTNAGHLPPLYISGSRVERLETGGMVVGLFDDVPYEQGTIEIDPGGLLIAYSDGLVEPENVYGEEFGAARLIEVAMRNRDASSHDIADAMMHAAEEWSGSPEQTDDMTVIVARLSAVSQEPHA